MKKKLNLEELSLELPRIESQETRFLLGGSDYGDADLNDDTKFCWWHVVVGDHEAGDNCGCGTQGGHNDQGGHDDQGGHGEGYEDGHDEEHDDDQDGNDNDYDPSHGYDEDTHSYDQSYLDNIHYLMMGGENQNDIQHQAPVNPITLPNLPPQANLHHQMFPGDCVPTNAEFVSALLGSPQSETDMMHEYGLSHNWTAGQEVQALQNGLGEGAVTAFLLQQFDMNGTHDVNEMTQAIDEGHPVMTSYLDGGSYVDSYGNTVQTGHEITIVGYDNATSQFLCYDSVTATYISVNYSQINTNVMSWIITGVKP